MWSYLKGSHQLSEPQIGPSLTSEMKQDLIKILFQYRKDFASDNDPLGEIRGHEVELFLNLERPYNPLMKGQVYPAIPRATEALETHINELMRLGGLRKAGHYEGVEVTTPVISN
ncbi:hypothetical protein O181_121774 [Austropuccinia psidii MF-1]|uniref:Uncharacterized protein n=1 Tax=Austropuccinia psidii MF-1 TaxID=1389203 RepID=A0A9Q3KJ95_9BASI|nr:hypothetical protein [Austropuccinia psidii MF-1]